MSFCKYVLNLWFFNYFPIVFLFVSPGNTMLCLQESWPSVLCWRHWYQFNKSFLFQMRSVWSHRIGKPFSFSFWCLLERAFCWIFLTVKILFSANHITFVCFLHLLFSIDASQLQGAIPIILALETFVLFVMQKWVLDFGCSIFSRYAVYKYSCI